MKKNTFTFVILLSSILMLLFSIVYIRFHYKTTVNYFIAPLLEKNATEINNIFSKFKSTSLKYGKIEDLEINSISYQLDNEKLEKVEIIYVNGNKNSNILKPFAIIAEERVPINTNASLSIMTCTKELTSLPLIIPGVTTHQEKERQNLKSDDKTIKELTITRKIVITYHDYDDVLLRKILKLAGLLKT